MYKAESGEVSQGRREKGFTVQPLDKTDEGQTAEWGGGVRSVVGALERGRVACTAQGSEQ